MYTEHTLYYTGLGCHIIMQMTTGRVSVTLNTYSLLSPLKTQTLGQNLESPFFVMKFNLKKVRTTNTLPHMQMKENTFSRKFIKHFIKSIDYLHISPLIQSLNSYLMCKV